MRIVKAGKSFAFKAELHRKKIDAKVERKWTRAGHRFGALTRTIAKRSIKSSRKRMPLSMMSKGQILRYKQKQAQYWKGYIKAKPQKPMMPSRPGDPPLNRTGGLKKRIRYKFDKSRKSVTLGLVNDEKEIAFTLEEGRAGVVEYKDGPYTKRNYVKFQKHPFIMPAIDKGKPSLQQIIRTS